MTDHSEYTGRNADELDRMAHEEMIADAERERMRELDDERAQYLADYGPEPPPTQAELDAERVEEIDELLLARGAFDDIAPPVGPPCAECEWPLGSWGGGRRWYHLERQDLDSDHDAEPCVCETVAGIVADRDPWCPLHGCEDALSGALWTNPDAARALARALASSR